MNPLATQYDIGTEPGKLITTALGFGLVSSSFRFTFNFSELESPFVSINLTSRSPFFLNLSVNSYGFLFFLGFQSDARQFEEAFRRVDSKVDRVAAVASQCSEGGSEGKRWENDGI